MVDGIELSPRACQRKANANKLFVVLLAAGQDSATLRNRFSYVDWRNAATAAGVSMPSETVIETVISMFEGSERAAAVPDDPFAGLTAGDSDFGLLDAAVEGGV